MTVRKLKEKATKTERCTHGSSEDSHPDHSEFIPRLNRVHGQLTGIEKMIGDGRYCVDILIQFRAVMAALRSVEVNIFEKHLNHCLSSALHLKDRKQVEAKIKELTELLLKRTSL